MQGEVSGTAPYFLVMTNANCRTHSCTVFNVTLNHSWVLYQRTKKGAQKVFTGVGGMKLGPHPCASRKYELPLNLFQVNLLLTGIPQNSNSKRAAKFPTKAPMVKVFLKALRFPKVL